MARIGAKRNLEKPVQTVAKGKNRSKSRETKSKKASTKSPSAISSVYSHWLVKSEPESRFENGVEMKFSFGDLKFSPDQTACWDGVRNYQARNFLRDHMKQDHDVFFYHSNCKDPGIVGICKVVRESYPDHTQFDKENPHYDSSSQKDNPKWFMIDVRYVRPLKRFISLAELKTVHQEHINSDGPLKDMALFTRSRLSVQPVSKEQWDFILQMEEKSS